MKPEYIGDEDLMEILGQQLFISNDNGEFLSFYIFNEGSISPVIEKPFESIQVAQKYLEKYFRNVSWTIKDCA